MDIRITLRAARVNADYTVDDAAHIAHVSKRTIINWEKGYATPRADKLHLLCDAYRMPIDNIFLPYESTKSEPAGRRDA